MSNRLISRRRGAGMTEYVVMVGLIAILLIGVVERFKNQIYVTIVGSANVLDERNVGGGNGNNNGGGPPKPATGSLRPDPGRPGKRQMFDGTNWVPFD